MSNIPIRAAEHPERVWEAQRQLFTRLYKEGKMKLPEVQRIMKDQHGFYARLVLTLFTRNDTDSMMWSERQYKRRIKKWKLEKNSKADEKTHALTLLQGSETRLDLASVYNFYGKDIAAHKLLRHARSRGIEPPNIGNIYLQTCTMGCWCSVVPKAVDRRCCSSLGRTERIARSQDFALDYGSGSIEDLFQTFFEMLDSVCHHLLLSFDVYLSDQYSSVILSGPWVFLSVTLSAGSPIYPQWVSSKRIPDHFTAVQLSTKRLRELLYCLNHLQSQKQCASDRYISEQVPPRAVLVFILLKLASEHKCMFSNVDQRFLANFPIT